MEPIKLSGRMHIPANLDAKGSTVVERAFTALTELTAQGVEYPEAESRVALAFHLTDKQAAEVRALYDNG